MNHMNHPNEIPPHHPISKSNISELGIKFSEASEMISKARMKMS